MTHPPHALSNLSLAKQYFDRLPADDISRRYYAGQKYTPTLLNRIKFLLFTDSILADLNNFYNHQPIVKRSYEFYKQKVQSYKKRSLWFSGISMFMVYQLARRNIVIPVLSKFGASLKTHRLWRQYFWLAVLPYTIATFLANSDLANQAERLWSIHANRLYNKILTDPQDSQYPVELLPLSQVHSWRTEWIHKYDLPKKWSNEVDISVAPDYAEFQDWEKVELAEAEEGGQADDAAQAEQ